jgi:hypothetical protein
MAIYKFKKIIARGSTQCCFFPIKIINFIFFQKVAKKNVFNYPPKKTPHHFTLTLLLFLNLKNSKLGVWGSLLVH